LSGCKDIGNIRQFKFVAKTQLLNVNVTWWWDGLDESESPSSSNSEFSTYPRFWWYFSYLFWTPSSSLYPGLSSSRYSKPLAGFCSRYWELCSEPWTEQSTQTDKQSTPLKEKVENTFYNPISDILKIG